MALPLDDFLRFDALTAALGRLADEHPGLVDLRSIGTSHEGRTIWLVTVTDERTGGHDTKPAHWVDANIHATELTGGVAALALLDHLVNGFGGDETVTRALQTRTFYIVPRVNPDGVEAALADRPRLLRSSTRPWPWRDAHHPQGLRWEDVDGDGRILAIRVPDPHGAWVPHPDEPRLLVDRPLDGAAPGPTYRVFMEGVIDDYDGFTVPTPSPREGLDLNRNFPAEWGPKVTGSGDFPGSEPEIQALLRAITDRPNICGTNAYHTFGGVLLRPPSSRPDSTLSWIDRWTWEELARDVTARTGYPVKGVYEDYTLDKADLMSGAADDWAYDHLGVYSWTTEYWDPMVLATGERSRPEVWEQGYTAEQELALLRWVDERWPGRYYVDWRPFDHPQLGPVEIGGWDYLYVWSNAPRDLLEAEVRPHAEFAVRQALAAPRLEIVHHECVALGGDTWRVQAGLANTGFLPTVVSERAAKLGLVLPVVAELSGAPVLGGTARVELGQLEGRRRLRFGGWGRTDGTPDRALASWVVRAAEGTSVTITATHPRAGRASTSVVLA